MVEKVAKISRVNTLSYDVHHSFEEGLDSTERDKKEFDDKLAKAINKKRRLKSTNPSIPDPYHLDLQRVTQSLFYDSDVTLNILKKFQNAIR